MGNRGPQPLSSLRRAGNRASRPGHRALARSSLLRDWFPCAGAAAGLCRRCTGVAVPLRDFIFLGSKITVDGDCSHEIKRCLLLGRKVLTNLDSIFKSRDITLPTKARLVKAMVFPVVMYGCESWTVKKAEHRRIDVFELWCWSPSGRNRGLPLRRRRGQGPHLEGRQEPQGSSPFLRSNWAENAYFFHFPSH